MVSEILIISSARGFIGLDRGRVIFVESSVEVLGRSLQTGDRIVVMVIQLTHIHILTHSTLLFLQIVFDSTINFLMLLIDRVRLLGWV